MAAFSYALFLCLIFGAVFANGQEEYSESDLRKRLFENYDKLVRPVRKVDDIVNVHVSLSPRIIRDVDTEDKTVKLDTWFFVSWEDAHLKWEPAEYAGLDQLSIPASEVWRPDVALYTATPDASLFPSVHSNVVIFPNGTVLWVAPFSFKSICPPVEGQVTEDSFQCTLEVGSWTYNVRRVTVQAYEQDILQGMGRESFKNTGEKWTLESMVAHSEQKSYSCCLDRYSLVKFDLLLRKKSSQRRLNTLI